MNSKKVKVEILNAVGDANRIAVCDAVGGAVRDYVYNNVVSDTIDSAVFDIIKNIISNQTGKRI